MDTSLLHSVKQEFMAYRNGIVADALRKAGYPQPVIFGLNLPQLGEIYRVLKSERTPEELAETARALWADRNVRESRLLAAWLLNPDLPLPEIGVICADVQTPEEADLLAFRWLRHSPHAAALLASWQSRPSQPYCWLTQALGRFLR